MHRLYKHNGVKEGINQSMRGYDTEDIHHVRKRISSRGNKKREIFYSIANKFYLTEDDQIASFSNLQKLIMKLKGNEL